MFNTENHFWRTISRCVDFIGLGLFCILLSIPIITIVPAFSALYYTVVKVFFQKNEGGFNIMLKAFLSNLKVGIISSLVIIPILIGMYLGDQILSRYISSSIGIIVYIGYFILMVIPSGFILFTVAIIGRFSYSVIETFKMAIILTIRHILTAILSVGIVLSLIWFTFVRVFPILITPVLGMLLIGFLFERVFIKYVPKEEVERFLNG